MYHKALRRLKLLTYKIHFLLQFCGVEDLKEDIYLFETVFAKAICQGNLVGGGWGGVSV